MQGKELKFYGALCWYFMYEEIFRSRHQKMVKFSHKLDEILAMLSLRWKHQGRIVILHLKLGLDLCLPHYFGFLKLVDQGSY